MKKASYTNRIKLESKDLGLRDKELASNGTGYSDPTAHSAITNIATDEAMFLKLMRTILYICDLAGFKIDCQIVMLSEDTGRRWKMSK